jgi:hypothetical protein
MMMIAKTLAVEKPNKPNKVRKLIKLVIVDELEIEENGKLNEIRPAERVLIQQLEVMKKEQKKTRPSIVNKYTEGDYIVYMNDDYEIIRVCKTFVEVNNLSYIPHKYSRFYAKDEPEIKVITKKQYQEIKQIEKETRMMEREDAYSRGLLVELSATRALCSHFIFSNFKNFQSIIFILFYENGSEKNESIMPLYYFKFKQNYESIMIKKLSS